jgi:hypothetical protein
VCVQVGSNTPNFNRMVGNPLAKQIPWDTNPTHLAAWKEGNTGKPVPQPPTHKSHVRLPAAVVGCQFWWRVMRSVTMLALEHLCISGCGDHSVGLLKPVYVCFVMLLRVSLDRRCHASAA